MGFVDKRSSLTQQHAFIVIIMLFSALQYFNYERVCFKNWLQTFSQLYYIALFILMVLFIEHLKPCWGLEPHRTNCVLL